MYGGTVYSLLVGKLLPVPHGSVASYNRGCRCAECRAAKAAYGRTSGQRASERARRRAWTQELQRIKLEQGCTDCGYREHAEALQFDHVRGIKLFEVGQSHSRARGLALAEIEKCDVVCANCHAVRTASRRESQVS